MARYASEAEVRALEVVLADPQSAELELLRAGYLSGWCGIEEYEEAVGLVLANPRGGYAIPKHLERAFGLGGIR